MIVPSGMKPVPFEINLTCQKPTIGAPTGATCGIAVACALAVAVVAFTGAECMSSAVAVLEVSGPSDAPHCAPALTASRLANTSVPNIVAIAQTIPFIGSPLRLAPSLRIRLQNPIWISAVGPALLKFADFEFDCSRYELRRAGHPVKLEKIPMGCCSCWLNPMAAW